MRRAQSSARRAWRPTVPVPAGQADAVLADTAGAGRWIVPWGHVGLAWSGKNESLAVIALWIGFLFSLQYDVLRPDLINLLINKLDSKPQFRLLRTLKK